MHFQREWDSSCPRIWDEWEKDGVKWVIQDIAPEDDEIAVKMMLEKFLPEEAVCSTAGVPEDPVSVASYKALWDGALQLRVSLGCFAEQDGVRTLAALNCCYVKGRDDPKLEIEGEAFKQVYSAMALLEGDIDSFALVGDDKYLYGLGMYVDPQFRGAGLATRLLKAREPLCKHLGVVGSFTTFTGPASQRAAEKAGYTTIAQISMKDMAETGLGFPRDQTKIVKYMWKKF